MKTKKLYKKPRECRNCVGASDTNDGTFCKEKGRIVKSVKHPCALKSGAFDEGVPLKSIEWKIMVNNTECKHTYMDYGLRCKKTKAHCTAFNCPIRVED